MLLLQTHDPPFIIKPHTAPAFVRSLGAVVASLTAGLPVSVAIDHQQLRSRHSFYKLGM